MKSLLAVVALAVTTMVGCSEPTAPPASSTTHTAAAGLTFGTKASSTTKQAGIAQWHSVIENKSGAIVFDGVDAGGKIKFSTGVRQTEDGGYVIEDYLHKQSRHIDASGNVTSDTLGTKWSSHATLLAKDWKSNSTAYAAANIGSVGAQASKAAAQILGSKNLSTSQLLSQLEKLIKLFPSSSKTGSSATSGLSSALSSLLGSLGKTTGAAKGTSGSAGSSAASGSTSSGTKSSGSSAASSQNGDDDDDDNATGKNGANNGDDDDDDDNANNEQDDTQEEDDLQDDEGADDLDNGFNQEAGDDDDDIQEASFSGGISAYSTGTCRSVLKSKTSGVVVCSHY